MMRLITLLLVLLLIGLGLRWLWNQRPRAKHRREIQALLLDCNGDQELAERLIFEEINEHPEMTYAQAARRARLQLRRDRR